MQLRIQSTIFARGEDKSNFSMYKPTPLGLAFHAKLHPKLRNDISEVIRNKDSWIGTENASIEAFALISSI